MYKQSILSASSKLTKTQDIQKDTQATCEQAIEKILQSAEVSDIELLITHFSSEFDVHLVGSTLSERFPGVQTIGCTSAGEFDRDGYQTHSIVILAFLKSDFRCATAIVPNLHALDFETAYATTRELRQTMQASGDLDSMQLMFLSYLDGLTMHEENFLHTFASVFGSTPHFGGSAADDLKLEATYVLHNGQLLQNAAVISLVGSKRPFTIFTNDHIETPVSQLVVTQADAETRTVYELNGEPAAEYYAKLLGKNINELTPEVFSTFPLAVLVDKKYFIRSIQKVNIKANSLTFYCAIDLGMILTFVQLGDCVSSLKQKLIELEAELGEAEYIYGCDCFLRRVEIIQSGQQQQIADIQKQYGIVGFNAYGEHVNAIHLNQTFTGVYFGRNQDYPKPI